MDNRGGILGGASELRLRRKPVGGTAQPSKPRLAKCSVKTVQGQPCVSGARRPSPETQMLITSLWGRKAVTTVRGDMVFCQDEVTLAIRHLRDSRPGTLELTTLWNGGHPTIRHAVLDSLVSRFMDPTNSSPSRAEASFVGGLFCELDPETELLLARAFRWLSGQALPNWDRPNLPPELRVEWLLTEGIRTTAILKHSRVTATLRSAVQQLPVLQLDAPEEWVQALLDHSDVQFQRRGISLLIEGLSTGRLRVPACHDWLVASIRDSHPKVTCEALVCLKRTVGP